MKTFAFFILFLFSVVFCFSQNGLKMTAEISQNFYPIKYTSTNLAIGVLMPVDNCSISLFTLYQFGGNLKNKTVPSYGMNYHMLGGGAKYRILNPSKVYSPTIQISALTEIASPYRGEYLSSSEYGYSFKPTTIYSTSYYSSGGNPSPPWKNYYYTYYYVSTPLIGSILIGHEFRLIDGLYFNLGLGYSIRVVKVRYKSWSVKSAEPSSDISNALSLKREEVFGLNRNIDMIHLVDLNVGLNYTFPLKRKK